MVRLTQSLEHWLLENHPDKIAMILLGHIELYTEEMQKAYKEWCKTDDGRQYLLGGSKYKDNDVYPDAEYQRKTFITELRCCKCGKNFIPAPMHIYHKGRKYYCSWTCYLHRDDSEVKTNDKGRT